MNAILLLPNVRPSRTAPAMPPITDHRHPCRGITRHRPEPSFQLQSHARGDVTIERFGGRWLVSWWIYAEHGTSVRVTRRACRAFRSARVAWGFAYRCSRTPPVIWQAPIHRVAW